MNLYIIFAVLTSVILGILLYPVRRARGFCGVVSLLFLIGGALLYSQFGTPEILPLLEQRQERLLVLKQKIITASQAVKNDSKDIKAWLELGDSFMETSQFDAARNAYKQAVLLSEGNPAIIMAYARALILTQDGAVNEEIKKSLDMVRLLDPHNAEAQYYLAVYKLQSGNAKEAMEDMKKLYQSLPQDSPLKEMIDHQIGRK